MMDVSRVCADKGVDIGIALHIGTGREFARHDRRMAAMRRSRAPGLNAAAQRAAIGIGREEVVEHADSAVGSLDAGATAPRLSGRSMATRQVKPS